MKGKGHTCRLMMSALYGIGREATLTDEDIKGYRLQVIHIRNEAF